jgi:hypothetical protein
VSTMESPAGLYGLNLRVAVATGGEALPRQQEYPRGKDVTGAQNLGKGTCRENRGNSRNEGLFYVHDVPISNEESREKRKAFEASELLYRSQLLGRPSL